MKSQFIEINKRILDRASYEREAALVKEYLLCKIEEIILQQDFSTEKNSRARSIYYCKNLDLQIEISIKRKNKLKAV